MTLTACQRKCKFPGVANQAFHNPSPFQTCMRTCVLSGPALCDPMDCNLLDSSVHGILQARILEWVAISSSRIFPTQGSNPCLLCLLPWQADSLPLHHLGSPVFQLYLILSHSSCTLTSLHSELLEKAQARPVLLLLGLFMSCCYRF